MIGNSRSRGWVLLALFSFCSLLAAQRKELKPGFNLFSKEQDVQLGKEAAAQIEKEVRLVDHRGANEFVQRIGQKLASAPEADRYPYTFKVVQDKSINAFALPGGPTYVHTGLVLAADNEAQLAGVMAHEIAHVALRHGTNQASKANLIQLPAMLAGALIGDGSLMGQLAQLGIGLGANSVLLKFSRSAERDADLLGARMMAQAGYNPIEMARFFEKLEAQGGNRSGLAEFLSSHPNPGNRVKAVEQEIRHLPRADYRTSVGNLNQVQSVLQGLPESKARKPSRGAAAPSQSPTHPSSGMREYRSREFTLSYPDNWEAFGDSDSAMLTIAPRDGLVRGPQGAVEVGYGIIVSYYAVDNRVNLSRDTDRLISQLQSGNPGMQVGREGRRRVRVNGSNGLVTTLYSSSPLGNEDEVDLLVTVARPQGLFYMVFIAPRSEFRQTQGTFEKVLQTVRFTS